MVLNGNLICLDVNVLLDQKAKVGQDKVQKVQKWREARFTEEFRNVKWNTGWITGTAIPTVNVPLIINQKVVATRKEEVEVVPIIKTLAIGKLLIFAIL